MKHCFSLLLLLFTTLTLRSQTNISGIVLGENSDTIVGANVFIRGAFDGASTNKFGSFSFTTIEKGNQTLVVRMIGYEETEKSIILDGKTLSLHIILKEKSNELNTVVITAGNFETGDVKKIAVLNSIDIATTAGATADIFGALKTLPGSQPAGEESGLFVRGGDASESRTFFDGMLVNNAFTSDLPDIAQRGRFSAFMFKGTSFSTGAYSAQYGQALSSTMALESKDLPEKTKSDIGIMTVGLDATHTHRFENSSLDVNVGYYNLSPIFSIIKQNTSWTKEPESVNTNASYRLKTGKTGMLKIYANYEKTHIGVISENFNDITQQVNYDIKSTNTLFNSTWQQYLGDSWKLNTGLAYSNDENNININPDKVLQTEKALNAKATITHYYGKLSDIKAGIEYIDLKNKESYNELSHQIDNPILASFMETNYFITNKLAIRAGARLESADIIQSTNLAPRLSLAYKIADASQVSFGYGRFYQVPEDKYLFDSKDYNFQNATHYILNYQYQKDNRTFRIEAYYKDYDQLLKQQSLEPDLFDNSGYGYAKGIDVFYRDTKTFKNTDFWISYSLLDTKRDYLNYPKEVQPSFAASNVLNIVYKYWINAVNTSLGATYTYASGRPYFNPNNPDFLADRTK
ncbi:MAG TPA: TonB-dependent receptor, partial [Saprospiraceae bacterium]|nr:TonB-dependent receptor [Saprospiraceae bacterium]